MTCKKFGDDSAAEAGNAPTIMHEEFVMLNSSFSMFGLHQNDCCRDDQDFHFFKNCLSLFMNKFLITHYVLYCIIRCFQIALKMNDSIELAKK